MRPSGDPGALPRSEVALLLIDFINPLDFDGAEHLEDSALAAARATAVLKRRAEARGIACIYCNDNYGTWHSNFEDVRRQCLRRAGTARAIARLLAPRQHDYTVLKPRHSAFYATPLSLLLERMQTRRVILTGLAADNCVLFTAMDAYVRGFELWIPSDCVAAEREDLRVGALAHVARVLKAETRPAVA